MIESIALMLVGGASLYFGAEWLVRGSAGIARSFGVRPLVVGLTVIAYGTSSPELVVSSAAAFDGRSGIVLGNVIGSNIANLGLILGLTALISPPRVEGGLIYRELPILIASAFAIPLLLLDGRIGRFDATVLLIVSAAFTLYVVAVSREPRGKPPEGLAEEVADLVPDRSRQARTRLAALTLVGLAVLLVGGKALVDGAVLFAQLIGMSDRVVGLTIVAVGTSLPELAASTIAALRGHSALAVGNVIGSNIFNVLLVAGAAGIISPVDGNLRTLWPDLAALCILTLVSAVFLRTERRMSRVEGAVLLALYAAFLVVAVAT